MSYAPQLDHTYQTTGGKYLMFRGTSDNTKTSFLLSSTQNITYDKDHCLSFWYYEDGEDPFSIYSYIVLPSYNAVIGRYTSAIENRRRWNLIKADILLNPSQKITSECILERVLIAQYTNSCTIVQLHNCKFVTRQVRYV